jgi:hypothetical protein
MKKINLFKWKFWKILASAIIFAAISYIVHLVESMMTMDFYTDPAYFAVWSKLMMPTVGPPPAEFAYASFGFALVTGLVLAYVYTIVRTIVPAKHFVRRGLQYGFVVFLVAGVPMALTMYLLINLPSMLLLYWTISSLVIYLLGGIVFAKLLK